MSYVIMCVHIHAHTRMHVCAYQCVCTKPAAVKSEMQVTIRKLHQLPNHWTSFHYKKAVVTWNIHTVRLNSSLWIHQGWRPNREGLIMWCLEKLIIHSRGSDWYGAFVKWWLAGENEKFWNQKLPQYHIIQHKSHMGCPRLKTWTFPILWTSSHLKYGITLTYWDRMSEIQKSALECWKSQEYHTLTHSLGDESTNPHQPQELRYYWEQHCLGGLQ